MSVPNQKTIIIHKSKQEPFLKVGIEELWEAYRNIKTPATFMMYLYLAGNAEGFPLELSRQAFENRSGYDKSSYHRAVAQLTKLGYIYEDSSGRLNFATVPKEGLRTATQDWEGGDAKLKQPIVKNESDESQDCNASYSEMNTEIENKDNRDKQRKIENKPQNYSYLDSVVGEDGSFSWKGIKGFVDGNDDPLFYDSPIDYQIKKMKAITPFDEGEIQYILANIIN